MKKLDKKNTQSFQKIKIHENSHDLLIEYKWFTPVAFFLVFFCMAWDSFLVFWYSMAGEAPWIFYVFPLVHVAGGIGLTYYTVCLFFNKTIITIDDQILKVKHGPLPWFGDKEIPASDIEQLYVKEEINNSKNGKSYTYQLRSILKSGEDIKLISERQMGLSNNAGNVKKLERKIEEFLGIQDYCVKGEYGAKEKVNIRQVRRTSGKKIDPTNITLSDLKKGYILNYNFKLWETIYQNQYDWKNGETDNLYRLTNESQDLMLLYIQKRMGVIIIWIEQKVDLYQLESANITESEFKNLPSKINFSGIDYLKEGIYKGIQFAIDNRNAAKTEQCFYVSENKTQSLRLVKQLDSALIAFKGNQAKEYEFSNILPK